MSGDALAVGGRLSAGSATRTTDRVEKSTVWILGAGFSHSLGGPLLNDLFTDAWNSFVQAVYNDNKYLSERDPEPTAPEDERQAHAAASYLRRVSENQAAAGDHRRHWADAEDLIGQLDVASSDEDGPAARRFRYAGSRFYSEPAPKMSVLRDAARRLVAAASCAFLKDADTKEERWQPYLSWAAVLEPSDTIVTFNYDRVLEHLATPGNLPIGHPSPYFDIVDPSETERDTGLPIFKPQVYKMHGSVDWHCNEEGKGESRKATYSKKVNEHEYALTCDGKHIGIATPGPTKRTATDNLRSLWDDALKRIEAAEVIVFIGYRFPPSDAEARKKLLAALEKNDLRHVELHVVLGPDLSHRDVVRLVALLRAIMAKKGRVPTPPRRGIMELDGPTKYFSLTTHPLFAEDFFTVWDRNMLWPKGFKVVD